MTHFVQIRCPTITVHGSCNRWQFEIASTMTGPVRFRCKHCKETSVVFTSEAVREVSLYGVGR